MKRKCINRSILLLVLWLGSGMLALAQNAEDSKAVVKTFAATDADSIRQVLIQTQYSTVNVSSWNRSDARVAVIVSVRAENADRARELLDKIEIEYKRTGDEARATTLVNGDADNFAWLRKHAKEFSIRYDIRLPSTAGLKVSNDFGTLQIDSLRGPIHTRMDYGNVSATALKNNNNYFEGDYANFHIHFLQAGKFAVDYAKIFLDFGFYVRIAGDYNTVHLQRIKKLNVDGDYNKIQAKRIKDLFSIGDFQEITVDRIYNIRTRGDYNKIVLHELGRGFHNFITSGDFTRITITNPKAVAYVLKMDTENSEWKISGLKSESSGKEKDTHIRTYYGKPDARALIRIEGDYLQIAITNPSNF